MEEAGHPTVWQSFQGGWIIHPQGVNLNPIVLFSDGSWRFP
jgi:hypothetical protein